MKAENKKGRLLLFLLCTCKLIRFSFARYSKNVR